MPKTRHCLLALLAVFCIGYLIPERVKIPVQGATQADWNLKSFWFEPWGASGVHKGIDIFGKLDTPVLSTTDGLVLYSGELSMGGKVVLVLGPKWRLHYYAHLNSISTSAFSLVSSGEQIATLGDSGNAKGKAPHLHYSIVRLIPAPLSADGSTQGYKKAFYLDPSAYLINANAR
ncbi:M23 family metallopeptidase [Ectopseudomonas mendocina]|uniref:M23 family metallopeptidase n=1 Tax=Ectopseudomonas mendocina TaxID=300 RepID=A0ABZ2RD75_ECTME